MPSSIVTPPISELDPTPQVDSTSLLDPTPDPTPDPTRDPESDHDTSEAIYPDPAKVPPYVAFVEASSFKPGDRESVGQVEVEIVRMTAGHVEWWHDTMQPMIKASSELESRADAKWNWIRNFNLLNVHNLGHLSTRSAHPAFGLTMIAPNAAGEPVPVGMMTLVPRYLCNSDRFGSKTYTWFVSSAPESFYREYFKKLKLHGVGKALFDAAIIASYRAGLDGSLLLHAAPEGGKELVSLYEGMGFKSIGSRLLPVTLFRWIDRKGYMLLQAKAAARIIKRNDGYRRKGYVAD